MPPQRPETDAIDGNTAVAHVAYRVERGMRDLPDHAVLDDGRACRRVVGARS